MAKRTKNPLNKRLPRELKGELGKYLVIFLFFVMSISLVSGFLVADNSLIASYHESFDKYNIEDGNFEFAESATDEALANIEKDGSVKVYPNFYKEEKTDDFESTFRVFAERKDIDKVCLQSIVCMRKTMSWRSAMISVWQIQRCISPVS